MSLSWSARRATGSAIAASYGCRRRGLAALGGRSGGDRDDHAVPMERDLHFLARLVDAPLHGRESDLEGLGDLRVGEPDDVTEEQRHLEIRVERLDGPPHGVDRLRALGR